jgi:hypothetical protein
VLSCFIEMLKILMNVRRNPLFLILDRIHPQRAKIETPSVLAKTESAIKVTPDKFTYLNPVEFPKPSQRPVCRHKRPFLALANAVIGGAAKTVRTCAD